MTDATSNPTPAAHLGTALALAWAALAGPAGAHEFWVRPETFELSIGTPVGVRLFVGDGFEKGRPYSRNPSHVREFRAISSAASEIPGRPGEEPAGRVTPTEAGVLALIYRSHPSEITLEAEPFESYLVKEGLEHVSRLREAAGESAEPGREAFSRCAKSLVLIPGRGVEGFDRPTGLDLEIIPLAPPFGLEPGTELPVRVLWKGEPVAGALIRAFVEGRPDLTTEIRTGSDGTAAVALTARGVWLLSTVHMERAAPGTGVDWESTWSSLTFEISALTRP